MCVIATRLVSRSAVDLFEHDDLEGLACSWNSSQLVDVPRAPAADDVSDGSEMSEELMQLDGTADPLEEGEK